MRYLFNKEDYILTFWTRGINVLVTDINSDGYSHLEGLYTINNGIFGQYFTKRSLEELKPKAIEFYGSEVNFNEYINSLKNHCSNFENFFIKEIKDKKDLTESVLREFFQYCVELCALYDKMNFEYTDPVFLFRNDNKIIDTNLNIVSKFKDEIRAFMGKVFFEKGGYLDELISILSKQFHISVNLIENSLQKEIIGLFAGTSIDKEVLRRQEAFVETNKPPLIIEGEEAKEILKNFEDVVVNVSEIKGQVASKGKTMGKVKIIPVNYADYDRMNQLIDSMEEGEVLVAETTGPELIVACKKASAIVTDIGGMMSHAAIVSREFKIPCIVGTKNATRVLKDGDLVEVDADQGIVRIIR